MDREPGEAGDLVSLHVTVKVLRPQVSGCPALGDDRVCSPRPGGACSKGWGICRVSAGCDPASAERAFLARVTELGAALELGAAHRLNNTPAPLICYHCHIW